MRITLRVRGGGVQRGAEVLSDPLWRAIQGPRQIQAKAYEAPSAACAERSVDIWHLTLPLQENVLICVVHGLDKRNNSPARQELFLQQVVAALSYFEKRLGTIAV
jgi:hypothetical protein